MKKIIQSGRVSISIRSILQMAVLFFILFCLNFTASATHISGADITYTWVSGNTYNLDLTLYRDCSGVSAPNNVSVSYSSVSCGYNLNVTLNKLPGTGQEITHPCTAGLTTCSGGTNPGIQKYEYVGTVTLPAQCTDWRFGYSICCRNCAITTLSYTPPNCTGVPALYVEATLNNVAAPHNSSPIFSNIPISFLCIGQTFHYNHGAFETDGDSITYAFITPRSAANTNVVFAPGYNVNSPISSSPAMTIDASGDILVTPTQTEVGVMAIIVREYHNGVLVGSVIRDMQIWTQPCSNILPTASGINGTNNFSIVACPGQPLSFNITSNDGNAGQLVTMYWNNSISGATFTSTGAAHPTGTFTWTPSAADARPQVYTFTVTVQDNNCPSAGFQTYSYDILVPVMSTSAVSTPSACATPLNGTATVNASGTSPFHYSWSPGGATTSTITGLGAGTYTVTATDANGCTLTATTSVTTPTPITLSTAGSSSVSCRGGNDGAAAISASGGTSPYTYSWSPSGGTGASASGLSAGTYTVTVTDAHACIKTSTVSIVQPALLLSSISGSTALLCHGDATGTATVNASGGTTPYSYNWSLGGATSTTLSGLAAGNYSVTTTDARGCTTVSSVNVTEPAAVSSSVSTVSATCGSSNGSATVIPSGGTSPYTYQWSPGSSTTATLSGVAAGAYTITITDAHGCTATDVAGISNLGGPTVSVASTHNVLCAGGNNGDATILVSGGTAPYTYQWNPSVCTGTYASGLQAGSYSVVVRDGNNCVSSTVVDITEPNPLQISLTPGSPSCFGSNNGSVLSSASGGVTPYTYTWSNGAGASANPQNLVAGNYQVTLTDAYGCTITESVTLTQPPQLNVAVSSNSPVSCNGGSNGSATVTASGGTTPYTYNWSPSVGALPTIVGLEAGSYQVTVSDANACTQNATVTITEPAMLLSSVSTSVPVLCHGDSTGVVLVNVSGGTTPYSYLWSGSGSTSSNSGPLPAGAYSVQVADARGCLSTATANITEPPALTTTILSPVNVSCFGGNDGMATVLSGGGTLPHTYLWSPSGGTSANASSLTANTYTVTVSDANNCQEQAIVSVNQPPVLTSSILSTTMNSCHGDAAGSVTIEAVGGTEPYLYQWSPLGGTNPNATNLAAGNYTVTVTDVNACTVSVSAVITEPPLLTLSSSTVPATCAGSNGSASVTPTGGTSPYSYLWSPGGNTTSSISSVPAGNYSVTVTDANGCTESASIAVSNIGGPTVSLTSTVHVLCAGASTGSASISVSGGTAPFLYQWSPSGGTSVNATGLQAGSYSVMVTDGNHCMSGLTVVITEPPALNLNIISTDALCAHASDGTATVLATGGVGAYTYAWTGGGSTGNILNGVPAGNYTVTVHDANGCVQNATAVVSEPPVLSLQLTTQNNVSCAGGSNGSATMLASGGTPLYQYAWSPTGGTSSSATGMNAGSYVLTVTDGNSCQTSVPVQITEPAPLQAAPSVTNVACNGGNTGSFSLNVSGGTTPYSYAWSNGAPNASSATSLVAGNYSVTVTDQMGCTITSVQSISEPSLLQATLSALRDVSCNGGNDGNAGVVVAGGTAPYTYAWSPVNGTSASLTGIPAGNYSVTVTDAHSCTDVVGVSISEPPVFTAVPSVVAGTCGAPNGSASVAVGGGTAPYTYQWSPGGGNTSSLNNLAAGTYTCTATDAHGCSVVNSMLVTNSGSMSAAVAGVNNVSCYGGTDGSLSVQVTGGTPPLVYTWTGGIGNAPIAGNLSAGIYAVTITDAFNCSQTLSINITEPALLQSSIAAFNNISCFGANDGSAALSVTGGTSPYTYRWNPNNDSTAQVAGLNPGTFTVDITDAHGCTSQSQVSISQPAALQVSSASTPATCGSSNGSVSASVTGGTLPYSYFWTPGGMQNDFITNIPAGSYSVRVTDAHNCQTTLNTFVSNIGGPSITLADSNQVSCFGGQNGSATVSVISGTSPFTYQWSPGGGTDSIASSLSAGSYSVIVADANNCLTGLTVAITEPSLLISQASATDALCANGNDGSVMVVVNGGTQPYRYSWSNGDSTAAVFSLPSGNYDVTVTDAHGCTAIEYTSISEPTPIVTAVSQNNVNCFGGNDGSILVENTGGTPAYTYSWSNNETSNAVSGLRAGTYQVTITDQHGCSQAQSVTIAEPLALALSLTPTDAQCFGSSDGIASASLSGGTPPYAYVWSPSGGTLETATGLRAGNYTVAVTDAHGCSESSSVSIGSPSPITLNATQTAARCAGSQDATATIFPSGGVSPYSYSWTGGSTNASVGAVAAGIYSVTVTDAHGCSETSSVQLSEPTPVSMSVQGSAWICIGQNATLSAVASGGTANYSYQWNTTATTASIQAAPQSTTVYTVSVTDANGCTAAPQTIQVNVFPGLLASTAGDDSICVGHSANLSVNPAGGNGGPYNYVWSNGAGTQSIQVSPAVSAIYTVTVSDNCGTPPVVLTVPVAVVSGPPADFLPNPASGCPPLIVQYRQQGTTPAGTTYMWDFGDGTTSINRNPTHTFTTPGHYTVRHIVTNGMGCRTEAQVPAAVEVFPLPEAAFSSQPDDASIFRPEISFFDESKLGAAWQWDFGDGQGTSTLRFPKYSYLDSGLYTVRLITTSPKGCMDTTYSVVRIRGEFAIFIPDAFTPNEDGVNDHFSALGIGIKDFELHIFDRWGSEIFTSANLEKGWDGTTNNSQKQCQADVYVYIIRVHDMENLPHQYLGHVTLVR